MEDVSSDWLWMVQDGLGSVRMEVDNTLSVEAMGSYAPYGDPFGVQDVFAGPFGYTGEQTDGNGQVYLRKRYYTPSMGVFVSRDPVETANRYAYVDGNVINMADPSGLIGEVPAQFPVCSAKTGSGMIYWLPGKADSLIRVPLPQEPLNHAGKGGGASPKPNLQQGISWEECYQDCLSQNPNNALEIIRCISQWPPCPATPSPFEATNTPPPTPVQFVPNTPQPSDTPIATPSPTQTPSPTMIPIDFGEIFGSGQDATPVVIKSFSEHHTSLDLVPRGAYGGFDVNPSNCPPQEWETLDYTSPYNNVFNVLPGIIGGFLSDEDTGNAFVSVFQYAQNRVGGIPYTVELAYTHLEDNREGNELGRIVYHELDGRSGGVTHLDFALRSRIPINESCPAGTVSGDVPYRPDQQYCYYDPTPYFPQIITQGANPNGCTPQGN